MATVSQKTILEYLADHYGIGRRGTNDTASSSTAISDDTVFGGPAGSEYVEVGSDLLVTANSNSSGNAPEGDVVRVSTKPSLSAGSMSLDPSLTAAGEAGDTFIVLPRPLTFDSGPFAVRQTIDKVLLEQLPEKLLVPITMVADGDMLASGVTNWTVTTATATKLAASFPLAQRSLMVVAGAAPDYASSATIQVDSGASYYLEATAWVSAGVAAATAQLGCWDNTNSAALTVDDDETTQQEPEILSSNVTTGSTTEVVRIRVGTAQDSATSYWSNVIFYKNGTREFAVQDRAELDRLGELFVASGTGWRDRDLTPLGHDLEQRTSGLWVYRLHLPVSGQALFYEEFRKPATLGTSLTATTYAPVEEVAAFTAERLLRPLRGEERWAQMWTVAAQDAAAFKAKRRPQRSTVNRAPRAIVLPQV